MTALHSSRSSSVAFLARFLALLAIFFVAFAPALRANPEEHTASTAIEKEAAAHAEGGEEKEEKGLPSAAPTLREGGIVNASMIVTWIAAAAIIIFAQVATRRIRSVKSAALEVPSGIQNFWEFIVESLRDFLESILGRDLTRKTFWFFASIFIFILFTNWIGLIPGVGTIGWGHQTANGFHVDSALLRGGNADLNMTFAMSMFFFMMWVIWAFQANGAGGFVKHLFAPKGETTGIMKVLMVFVFFCVGILEVVSIMFRPVSLSFRLYGNIFAGENLLESMQHVSPAFGWLTPLPFYFMELMVGLVQALVFMLLTAVFTLLICTHDEEHGEHGHGGPGDEPDKGHGHAH